MKPRSVLGWVVSCALACVVLAGVVSPRALSGDELTAEAGSCVQCYAGSTTIADQPCVELDPDCSGTIVWAYGVKEVTGIGVMAIVDPASSGYCGGPSPCASYKDKVITACP